MGGSVGFTLREENGKEHRMCRWTNAMPWAVNHIGIVHKDPIHVRDVLGNWYDMVDDYNAGRHDKSPMAECYVPYAGLNPTGYGLIVVDMQKNVILNMQGYTHIGGMAAIHLVNEMRATSITSSMTVLSSDPKEKRMGKKAFKRRKPDDDNDCVRFMDFVYDGRVREVEYYLKETDEIKVKPVDFKSITDVANYLKVREHAYENFLFDMSPFEVMTFEEGKLGCQHLYEAVKELGFVLTPQEEESWVKYMERWDDD